MAAHRWSRPYASPNEALTDFLDFYPLARRQLEAHPEWKEWLLQPEIIDPRFRRGPTHWEQERELVEIKTMEVLPGLALLRELKELKERESLRIAVLDFAGFPVLEGVMTQLSDLADFCLKKALGLVRGGVEKEWNWAGPPFTVVALGRWGGRELGYGSDLAVRFIHGEEDDRSRSGSRTDPAHEFSCDLARRLVDAFHHSPSFFQIVPGLKEGPNPVVQSLTSYENEYSAWENIGERMTLLQARYGVGHAGLGEAFLRLRKTFSYPGHLTQEILGEIAALKKRVDQEVHSAQEQAHPLRQGGGVLRKIEFMVQALQLLHGASHSDLQQTGTLAILQALQASSLLTAEKEAGLAAAYRFWRYVEHRGQMRSELSAASDQEEDVRKMAECLGFNLPDFEREMEQHRLTVDTIFSEIYTLPSPPALHFDPFDFFPDSVQTREDLARLLPEQRDGSSDPRTRHALAHLGPALRSGLRGCVDPPATVHRLSEFVAAYRSRTLLYESLATNPQAVQLLLTVLDQSAYFSSLLRSQPDLLEEMVRSSTLNGSKSREDYGRELAQLSGDPTSSHAYLRSEQLRLFIRDVMHLANGTELAAEFTLLAEACLELALARAEPSSPLALIGLGRLGGSDLGYGSPLEIIILGEDREAAQRVIRFLKEQVSGELFFPLDFAFPTAAHDFKEDAPLEKIQALNRARFVAGDYSVASPFLDWIDQLWRNAGARSETASKVEARRDRIERERADAFFPSGNFKTGPGGLIEIEFGLQKFLLARGHREPNLQTALDWMKRVHPAEAEIWREGLQFLRRVETVLSRDTLTPVSRLPSLAPEREVLARKLGFPSFSDFFSAYQEQTGRIRAVSEVFRHRPI